MSEKLRCQSLAMFAAILYLPIPAYSSDDEDAIARLMIESYVEAVYVNRDENAVRQGFHPDFVLHVKNGDLITKESLTQWLQRLNLDGVKSGRSVDYEIDSIDVTGDSAVAKLRIYLDSQLVYSDYFGFYRFDESWRFINKTFYAHE